MKYLIRAASLFALLSLPAAAFGQTATLVRDINTTVRFDVSDFRSSAPSRFLALGNKALFTAGEASSGHELWVSDGTASGTRMLQDFCPGECSSNVYPLGVVNGVAVGIISPVDDHSAAVLWRSDGTRAGTYLLTPPEAPYSVSWPDEGGFYTFLGKNLYFHTCPPEVINCEIWRTDGTLAGTRMVHRATTASFSKPVAAGGKVFFLAWNGFSWELWKTDGTTASRIADLGNQPYQMTVAGDRLFFLLDGDSEGTEVWVSDGTKAGTRTVTAFEAPEPFDNDEPEVLRAIGNRVYFVADDVLHGFEIWRSDGSPAQRVTDFGFYGAVEARTPLAEVGGRLIFAASDGLTEKQLWMTDGKPESVRPVRDLCPGGCDFLSAGTSYLFPLGGKVLFFVQTRTGRELWSTDGTAAATRRVKELCPGNCAPDHPSFRGALPGDTFVVLDLYRGGQLWRSDGTEAGTRKVLDLTSRGIGEVAKAGNRIFFNGPSSYGQELWVIEGGQARLVTDIARQEPSSRPQELTALGERLFFIACDGVRRGVWSTSGTPETTAAVPDNPGDCTSDFWTPSRLRAVGGWVFFVQKDPELHDQLWSTDGQSRVQLTHFGDGEHAGIGVALQGRLLFPVQAGSRIAMWQSDGTPGGTAEVFELPELSRTDRLVTVGSEVYFTGFASGETRVWRTDGTAAGTRRISDEDLSPLEFTRVGSQVFFVANGDNYTVGLWKTDGTAAGTTPVLVPIRDRDQPPTELTSFQEKLYFFAPGPEGWALWRSDGTEEGTAVLYPFRTPVEFQTPPDFGLTVLQSRLYFAADDGVHGTELWTSDGTAAGTRMVADLLPGPLGSSPHSITVAAGKLWFAATDGLRGVELWRSDGTAAGTRLVQDLAPLAASSHPEQLTVAGNRLYFVADDGTTGRELWSLPVTGPAGCQPSPTRLCLGNGRYQVEVTWRDFQNKTGPGSAVSLTSDTGYFWFFDASNVEVILKVLDGRSLNGHVWVFYGALSNVEYTLTVTDTQTGLSRRYFNPSGQLASVGDTTGFGPLGAYSRTGPPAAPPSPLISERAAAATGSCQPSATRLCLRGGRFAVEASWKDFQGKTGKGTAVNLTGDTGYFWFFDAANVEVVLKVLDGTPANGKHWVFYGALSNVEYTLTVTDTQTGKIRTYKNPSGRFASVADTAAF